MTRLSRVVLVLVVTLSVLALVPWTRIHALETMGRWLVVNDPVKPVDIVALPESGDGGEAVDLEVSDLYREGVAARILLLVPTPTGADRELTRRGVTREDLTLLTLVQLGVPRSAIASIDSGEGGTTESTQALAAWVADH